MLEDYACRRPPSAPERHGLVAFGSCEHGGAMRIAVVASLLALLDAHPVAACSCIADFVMPPRDATDVPVNLRELISPSYYGPFELRSDSGEVVPLGTPGPAWGLSRAVNRIAIRCATRAIDLVRAVGGRRRDSAISYRHDPRRRRAGPGRDRALFDRGHRSRWQTVPAADEHMAGDEPSRASTGCDDPRRSLYSRRSSPRSTCSTRARLRRSSWHRHVHDLRRSRRGSAL